jgi:RimJ/RimL family protein N-acetyltransferase
MAGDVNLYWNDPECAATAEIEVMVAEAASRRRGVAAEALRLLMAWAIRNTGVQRFRAKIGFDNAPSLALFRKLGFAEVSRSEVFREATLELAAEGASSAAWAELAALGGRLDLRSYDGGGG